YWVTQSNELAFNSPMKYLFTNVTIEYVPLAALEYNSVDGRWYLPQSLVMNNYNFTDPFFVSSLWVNSTSYGTYIHPDIDVDYIVGNSSDGIFVEFDDSTIVSNSTVQGAVHFGKINDTYLYKFSLKDELLYKYNIVNDDSSQVSGTLHIDLNAGFTDVIYSELSQVTSDDYYLILNLYQFSDLGIQEIGTTQIDLDNELLGYHYYSLDIGLFEIEFFTGGDLLLAESITRGTNYDLYITIESSISNSIVDGNLFKGSYAHELLSVGLQIDLADSDLLYDNNPVDSPLISLPQNDIILIKTNTAEYAFNSSVLLYDFEFTIDSLRTDTVQLYENVHYTFSADLKTITLIGFYRDYSGLLFANITYDAFEWKAGSISTLQPITLTFTEDYIGQITKYLEFVIGFNKIPGYDLEKIDTNSGRLVLSEEQKSSTLIKIYIYNFQKEAWDLVNFVVYSDYSGTNTFSYVVDRKFIEFEQYFNKTGSEEFQIKAIFTVEENLENYSELV
ncbi:hypothetical protein LCGC14_2486670, partial [marine sediment metagenome]